MRENRLEISTYQKFSPIESKLIRVGFTWSEVGAIFSTSLYEIERQRFDSTYDLPEEFYGFIHRAMPSSESRVRMVGCLFANLSGFGEGVDNFRTIMLDLYKMETRDKDVTNKIFDTTKLLLSQDPLNIASDTKLKVCLQVLRDETLFRAFGSSVIRLANFTNENAGTLSVSKMEMALNAIHKGTYKEIFFKGVDESAFHPLLGIPFGFNNLPAILDNKSYSLLANEFLRNTSNGWLDKLQNIPKIAKLMGFPIVKDSDLELNILHDFLRKYTNVKKMRIGDIDALTAQIAPEDRYKYVANELKLMGKSGRDKYRTRLGERVGKYEIADKETLDRVRRRESPDHPLNTLKIAKTVGYEIEFDSDEKTNAMMQAGLFEMLSVAGFKAGEGGNKSYETSPGPFYDPTTANLVFGTYCDLGIIDLRKYNSLTYHFNVGVIGVDLTPIVRAMHLCGHAYNPHKHFSSYDLQINSNTQDKITYTECKTFDVVTKEGFEWNMKSASLLSWALDAYIGNDLTVNEAGYKWAKELRLIWKKYVSTLLTGLKSAHLESYLFEESHGLETQAVARQLKQIFPTKSSRYSDLSRIGVGSFKILGVTDNGKHWPNLAYFATDVTNEAVQAIERVADSLEEEVARDIQLIEKSFGAKKNDLITKFCKKYKSTSYDKVKKLFI